MAEANPLRGQFISYYLPGMTMEQVDSWITYNKSVNGRTYDQLINDMERTKSTYPETQVIIHKNLDTIIGRLKVLSRKEKIDKVNTDKSTTLAVRDVFEKRTGQTGDPKLSSVKNILGYAGIKTAGKKRTLKKRKRTVKRKHYRV